MFRYVAVAWSADDLNQEELAKRVVSSFRAQSLPWEVALDRPGLVVLFADSAAVGRPQVFGYRRGVVLGTLFRAPCMDRGTQGCERAILGQAESEEVLATWGKSLIDQYWGNYVAILCDEEERSIRVIRGPASTLPCLHASCGPVHLYFSWTEACAQIAGLRFSVDWTHVARTLFGPSSSGRTDLREVSEILPGTCERLTNGRRWQEALWDPEEIASSRDFQSPLEAAMALRAVARFCGYSWASVHRKILLGLSGGLDSSIALACLADAPSHPEIVCLNQYADASSDERPFARMAAQRAGCELIEFERGEILDFRTAMHSVRTEFVPGLRFPEVDRIEVDAALRQGATAVMRGDGGDELFARNAAGLAVGDFIRERGFRREVFALAMHAATMEGSTVHEVLTRGIMDALRPRRRNPLSVLNADVQDASLLNPDLVQTFLAERAESRGFPLESAGDHGESVALRLPPVGSRRRPGIAMGRLLQIELVCGRRPFYGPFSRLGDPEPVLPLLSQPVIETCLRIPTYFQVMGRRDRSLARLAFAEDLPPAIAARRDKGLAERLAADSAFANLAFIREMLLDGIVIKQGIVDRVRLEAALSPAPSAGAVPSVALFNLLGAEIWARAWRSGEAEDRATRSWLAF